MLDLPLKRPIKIHSNNLREYLNHGCMTQHTTLKTFKCCLNLIRTQSMKFLYSRDVKITMSSIYFCNAFLVFSISFLILRVSLKISSKMAIFKNEYFRSVLYLSGLFYYRIELFLLMHLADQLQRGHKYQSLNNLNPKRGNHSPYAIRTP